MIGVSSTRHGDAVHARAARDLNLRGAYLHMAADALLSLGVVVAGAVIVIMDRLATGSIRSPA